jgi:hypothetical protein
MGDILRPRNDGPCGHDIYADVQFKSLFHLEPSDSAEETVRIVGCDRWPKDLSLLFGEKANDGIRTGKFANSKSGSISAWRIVTITWSGAKTAV